LVNAISTRLHNPGDGIISFEMMFNPSFAKLSFGAYKIWIRGQAGAVHSILISPPECKKIRYVVLWELDR
jgi:hypothetical protein